MNDSCENRVNLPQVPANQVIALEILRAIPHGTLGRDAGRKSLGRNKSFCINDKGGLESGWRESHVTHCKRKSTASFEHPAASSTGTFEHKAASGTGSFEPDL
jgi:hypothetical protein